MNNSLIKWTLATSTLAIFSLQNSTLAFTISLDGTNYDITTFITSYNDNSAILQSQPWWGNATKAETAAGLVSTNLGFPNSDSSGLRGPFFAYQSDNLNPTELISYAGFHGILVNPGELPANSVYTYAVVAVPEPFTVIGTLIGSIAVFRMRKRLKAKAIKD
jgi:hypothetical protein